MTFKVIAFLFAVVVCVHGEYEDWIRNIPNGAIQALKPKGLRVYLPGDPRIKLFLFEGLIQNGTENKVLSHENRDFWGLGVKQKNRDGWIYEDHNITLKVGQTIVHRVFVSIGNPSIEPNGTNKDAFLQFAGYYSPKEMFTVKELHDPTEPWIACPATATKVRGGYACAQEVIFEDNFDNFREDLWQIEQYIPINHPEHPFVSYQRPLSSNSNSNIFIENGFLNIVPKLQQDILNQNNESIHTSTLDLLSGVHNKYLAKGTSFAKAVPRHLSLFCTIGLDIIMNGSPDRFRPQRPILREISQLRRRYYSAQVCAQTQVHPLFPNPMGRQSDTTGKSLTPRPLSKWLKTFLRCTGDKCVVQAMGVNILPPIVSGRLTSARFAFTYGTIYIRAKLPRGDWIYPEILLESSTKKYGSLNYASGVLKVVLTRGNIDTNSPTYSAREITGGPIIHAKCRDSLAFYHKTISEGFWTDEFHDYVLQWAPDEILLYVDGVNFATYVPGPAGLRAWLPKSCRGEWYQLFRNASMMAPFDHHIALGVAVGGIMEFSDGVTAGGKPKPWKNRGRKASFSFWQDKENWYPTWTQPGLVVDYVRVVAL